MFHSLMHGAECGPQSANRRVHTQSVDAECGPKSADRRVQTANRRTQTTEYRPQSADRRVQIAECRPLTADRRPQSTGRRVQTAECRPQSADRRVQTTECRPQSADRRVQTAECRPQSVDRRPQTLTANNAQTPTSHASSSWCYGGYRRVDSEGDRFTHACLSFPSNPYHQIVSTRWRRPNLCLYSAIICGQHFTGGATNQYLIIGHYFSISASHGHYKPRTKRTWQGEIKRSRVITLQYHT